jgi:uncharacterized membrane protein
MSSVLYETSIDIDASRERVWAVLIDIERWPEWTRSMTSLEHLDAGELRAGSRVRIKQPRLPTVVWQVTELEPMQSFWWTATGGGMTTVAGHEIAARPGDGSGVVVSLSIRQTGPLARVFGLLAGSLTRRYVQLEAQGLKRRCEAG